MTNNNLNRNSSVWIYRHADRIDEEDPSWLSNAPYKKDPPLSPNGFATAIRMGNYIWHNEKDKLLQYNTLEDVKIFSSPFLRCLQTSHYIAKTIEERWEQETNKTANNTIKICIEYGLAEDIPSRNLYNPLDIATTKELVVSFLNPNTDTDIIDRLDTNYQSKYSSDERLTYDSNEEYSQRVNDIYQYLMKSKYRTILISSHFGETHFAYCQITNLKIPIRYRYGLMANFISIHSKNNQRKTSKWEIKHRLWDHHQNFTH
jgi:broad specificity phosphatase PhoE